jgi:hypothetical protein
VKKTETRTAKEVIRDVVGWVLSDSDVDDLDEDVIARCLQQDTNGDPSKLPTENEVYRFVCGEETEEAELRARWPALDAYLTEQLT